MASGRFKAFRGANKITFDYSLDCDITVKAYLSNFLWEMSFFRFLRSYGRGIHVYVQFVRKQE